jgi:hypothetical protein
LCRSGDNRIGEAIKENVGQLRKPILLNHIRGYTV